MKINPMNAKRKAELARYFGRVRGGKSRSAAKRRAARLNGKKGGRPHKAIDLSPRDISKFAQIGWEDIQ